MEYLTPLDHMPFITNFAFLWPFGLFLPAFYPSLTSFCLLQNEEDQRELGSLRQELARAEKSCQELEDKNQVSAIFVNMLRITFHLFSQRPWKHV